METLNFKNFTHGELLHAELAIAHILVRYNEHSNSVGPTDYRTFDHVLLSSSEAAALNKVLINICKEIHF